MTTISILFVLCRMRGVELDYEINNTQKRISKVELEKKELMASKAKLLSVKRLRKLPGIRNILLNC